MTPDPEYDARHLAGVACFNRGDYFAAHEAWEEIWLDGPAADRRFYQSLIQAAVALYHWGNGNRVGARRLFHAGRAKAAGYPGVHHGVALDAVWRRVEAALAPALADAPDPPAAGPPPRIDLAPASPA